MQFSDFLDKVKRRFFKLVRLIPRIRNEIDSELQKVSDMFAKDVSERTKNLKYITTLPQTGLSKEKILEIVNENLNLGIYSTVIIFFFSMYLIL